MARTRQTPPPVVEPQLPATAAAPRTGRSRSAGSTAAAAAATASKHRRSAADASDVLVSAVISTYLLTHLHHVLQRAEYGAQQEGRQALAANYAQLRKVLCLDARTMEDASASGMEDEGQSNAA
jgi:hypothetical protein